MRISKAFTLIALIFHVAILISILDYPTTYVACANTICHIN